MHGAKTYPRSQGWIPSPLLKPAHLQNLTLAKRNPNDKSQNDKTHLRRKEWWNKEKEAELFFPVTVPVLLRLLRLRTCVKEKKKKYQHTLADAEHTPLSKPDGTEKQESDWKVCLWPQTHWPCDMKGRVNGCHRVCDWSGRSRERLGVQAGGSRLGANQGEKYNQTFWGNMGCLYMSGAADTSYHWPWLHRGELGPKSTVLHCENTRTRLSSRESGHKGLCERLQRRFSFLQGQKTLDGLREYGKCSKGSTCTPQTESNYSFITSSEGRNGKSKLQCRWWKQYSVSQRLNIHLYLSCSCKLL